MKDRIKGLKLNKRLMFGTRFFLELKSINSVIQLFYLSRGLDLGQVVYLSLAWTITSFFCDIPSSFLADKFGRKKLIISGIILTSISTFMLFSANSFLMFVVSYIVAAAGYSFFMGTDQAIIYDSLKEVGEENKSNRVAGKYYSAQSLPKIFMPFIGSLLAKDLLPGQFNILIIIDLIGTIIAIIMASFLTEPKVEIIKRKTLALFKEGINLIRKDSVLLKFALNKIIIFQAAFVYWRVYQVFLKNNGMPVYYLGLIYTGFASILFFMFWHTEKVQRIIGKLKFANLMPVFGFMAVTISLLTNNLIVLFIACVVLLIVGTVRDPFFMSQMQGRIHSFNRATATSTLNTIKNISDIPIYLLIGYLAKINVNYVLVVSGILFLIPMIFLRIKKEEIVI